MSRDVIFNEKEFYFKNGTNNFNDIELDITFSEKAGSNVRKGDERCSSTGSRVRKEMKDAPAEIMRV